MKSDDKKALSRRDFLAKSALGAGGVAAVGTAAVDVVAQAPSHSAAGSSAAIRIPADIPRSLGESPDPGSFEKGMTGAQVFAKACKDEGLAALMCCPGNYTVIGAIATAGVPAYGGRTEGSMCAAADAFARVTGEVAATSGTEGPGFSNMMMEYASAYFSNTPLLLLASNVRLTNEDRYNGVQMQLQQPMTEGLKKWGKRLIVPNRVWEYASYAFRQLKSGVPGPVHLDFPGEVAGARFTDPSQLERFWDASKYRCESVAHPAAKEVTQAVEMIQRAERPLIVAGPGVFYRKGWEALHRAAEKNDIAVCATGPMRGHFADDGHRLSANTAEKALLSVDLVVVVGQYQMANVGEWQFGPDAKMIRVHPAPEDLGRNWPLDLGIVSDERAFLDALADALPRRTRQTWVAELASARDAFEKQNDELYALGLKYSTQTGVLHPAVIGKQMGDFLHRGSIPKEQTTFVIGSYTGSHWVRRWLRAYRPGQFDNVQYQYLPIGPDFGHLFGIGVATQLGVGPQKPYQGAPVFGFTGDAGCGYSIMEMETLAKYRIPAVMVVYNNDAWGVFDLGNTPRSRHMYLFQENLRYEKIAEALGARGEYVRTPAEFTAALKRSYDAAAKERVSTIINVQSSKEFTSREAFPPGRAPSGGDPGVGSYRH
jgi:thiamine pyrophosphate-dependent acetolactate synthase large subunit-like protein